MIKGVIFDCDGVLLDSEPLFAAGQVDLLKGYGIEDCQAIIDEYNGTTMDFFAKAVIERCHLDENPESFVIREKQALEPYFSDENLAPMPGLLPFLAEMKKRGIRMGIASSSDRTYVLHKTDLFGITDYFQVIVTGDMITHSKPDPEIYNKAVSLMNLEKQEILVVEDAPKGIASAAAAGLFTAGLKASEVVQDTSEADIEVNSYQELLERVFGI